MTYVVIVTSKTLTVIYKETNMKLKMWQKQALIVAAHALVVTAAVAIASKCMDVESAGETIIEAAEA